jgi:pimeloyl-ACP methyl ester carboxylesterase
MIIDPATRDAAATATAPIARAIYRRSGHGDRAVVFIHGFLDGGSVWDDVVARLVDRDVERVQIDLAGMGDRVADEGPYTLTRFAADVGAVVAEMRKPVVVVGQSMGAQVAELVAAAVPDRVAGLVLLTPVPLGGTNLPDEAIAPFQALGGNPAAQRAVRRTLSVNLDEHRVERLGAIGDRITQAAVAAAAQAWNHGHRDGDRASRYRGPVLIVRGGGDPFVTDQMIASAIAPRFEHAATVSIDGAGHWPHVEQPGAFAKVLAEFLDAVWRSAASQDPAHDCNEYLSRCCACEAAVPK